MGRGRLPDGVVAVPVRQEIFRHVYAVRRAEADRRPSIRAAVEALYGAARMVNTAQAARD